MIIMLIIIIYTIHYLFINNNQYRKILKLIY